MAQPAKVKRYRAGKPPLWDSQALSKISVPEKTQKRDTPKEKPDTRLARIETLELGDEQERLQRHRRIIHEASVIDTDTNPEDVPLESLTLSDQNHDSKPSVNVAQRLLPSENSEDIEKRRMKAREHAENGAEEELPYEPDDEVENDEENESSSVSDSEEAQDQWNVGVVNRLLPRFVKKEKRQTISEKEQLQKEEERLKEEKEKAVKERKDRTRQLLKEAIEREKTSKIIEEEVVLTDDDENEETQQKEYELWKLRELVRIRRERDDREKWRLERLEVDRLRSLTDEELMNEKRKNKEGLKDKKYMKYLQKYYHKGAFFHENIRDLEKTHEWTAATGEDKWIDRTMLPKVMQVKNFGRAGRTKYTHLKNEDTTKTDDPWSSVAFNPQYLMKLGGFGGGFDRPAKKRKIANPVIL